MTELGGVLDLVEVREGGGYVSRRRVRIGSLQREKQTYALVGTVREGRLELPRPFGHRIL